MVYNTFKNDSDCGPVLDFNDYPSNIDSSYVPDDLYYNAEGLRRMQNDVEVNKLHHFGGPHGKYRYWKLGGIYVSNDKNELWLSELKFFENGKIFFNGRETDNSNCITTNISNEIVSIKSTLSPSGAPYWWERFGDDEPVRGVGTLIDGDRFSSARFTSIDRGLDIEIDFGEKRFAISSITQTGVRFPHQTMFGFTLYARNSEDDEWSKISTYDQLPDPVACSYTSDDELKFYGPDASYYSITKENLYTESGHIIVIDSTPQRDSFPIDVRPIWGASANPRKFRYFKIDTVLPFSDGITNSVGPTGPINYPSTSSVINGLEFYEGGWMYDGGQQYVPGTEVTDQIMDYEETLVYGRWVQDDDGWRWSASNGGFFGSGTVSITSRDSSDYLIVDFGDCNRKAITSIRQISDTSPGRHIEGFTLYGRNTEKEEWVELNKFGQLPDGCGDPRRLPDPWTGGTYDPPAPSEHYAVMETGTGNVIYAGDAAPMWFQPPCPKRELEADWIDIRNNISLVNAVSSVTIDLRISTYDRFVIYDGQVGFGQQFDSGYDIYFSFDSAAKNGRWGEEEIIEVEVEVRGATNRLFTLPSSVYFGHDGAGVAGNNRYDIGDSSVELQNTLAYTIKYRSYDMGNSWVGILNLNLPGAV